MESGDQQKFRYAVKLILQRLLKHAKDFDAQKLFNFSDGIYMNPLKAHCMKRTLMSFELVQPNEEEVHRFNFTLFYTLSDVYERKLDRWGKWTINLCFRFLHQFADIRTLLAHGYESKWAQIFHNVLDHQFHKALRIVGQKAFECVIDNLHTSLPTLKALALETFLKSLREYDADRFLKILLEPGLVRKLDPPIFTLKQVPYLAIDSIILQHSYTISTDESSEDYLYSQVHSIAPFCFECELRSIPLYNDFCLHCTTKCQAFCDCEPCGTCLKDIEIFKKFVGACYKDLFHPHCLFITLNAVTYDSWHEPSLFLN